MKKREKEIFDTGWCQGIAAKKGEAIISPYCLNDKDQQIWEKGFEKALKEKHKFS